MTPGPMLPNLQNLFEGLQARLGDLLLTIGCDCFLRRLQLEDDGRRIDGWAEWKVTNVSRASDLILIARHDYSGAGRYVVEVNGRRSPMPLVAAARSDPSWGEAWVRIPKRVLVDGTNTIRITRDPKSERDAEWYYMWFLQDVEPRS